MPFVLRLALSNLRVHRTRFLLAVLATAMAAALVVSITSGFASLDRVVRSFTTAYLGAVDFEFDAPIVDRKPPLPQSLLDDVRRDPRVRSAHGRIQRDLHPIREDGGVLFQIPSVTLFGIDPTFDPYVKVMRPSAGKWFDENTGNVVVVDSNLAGKLELKPGDTVRFPGRNGVLELKVVGVVKVPTIIGGLFMSAFAPLDTLRSFIEPDGSAGLDRVRGEFQLDVDSKAFVADWSDKLRAALPTAQLESKRESRQKIDDNLRGMRIASLWASSISVLAAGFIIFSTLSMGVAERRRQLAMLRAVGALRSQVAKLVLVDALLIAVSGAALGVPLGVAFVHALARLQPDIFTEGVAIDPLGLIWAAVSCAGAALLASVIPAFIASRASPLEAMAHQADPPPSRWPWRSLVCGMLLASLDSVVCFVPLDDVGRRLGVDLLARRGHDVMLVLRFAVTVPLLLLGLFLIAPMVVMVVERVVGRALAALAGLRFELVRQQVSGSIWRAAGTAAALMIGLTVLITINAQGRSTLQGWRIPTRFPDVFVFVNAGAGTLSQREIDVVRQTPGVRADRVLPIRVTIPGLGDNFFDLASWVKMPGRTMFIATDPSLLLDMMDLDFRDGTPDDARRMMTRGRRVTLADGSALDGSIENGDVQDFDRSTGGPSLPAATVELRSPRGAVRSIPAGDVMRVERGRYVLVTNEVQRVKSIGVGDVMPLARKSSVADAHFDYTIVGVVWSPGVDVIINAFDLPNRVQAQTAYAVFGTLHDVERDFGQFDNRLVAADLEKGVNSKAVQKDLQQRVNDLGLTVIDVREFRDNLVGMFNTILAFMSLIAWAAMAVASLGVGNAIVAGVRTRQWQFGVLRSIGLTSGQLLRLVLVEGLLLGASGAALGLIGGVILTTNAHQFYAELVGIDPPLVVPWDVIGSGVGLVLLLSLAMSAWPAIATSRREPLALLQAGRAST